MTCSRRLKLHAVIVLFLGTAALVTTPSSYAAAPATSTTCYETCVEAIAAGDHCEPPTYPACWVPPQCWNHGGHHWWAPYCEGNS